MTVTVSSADVVVVKQAWVVVTEETCSRVKVAVVMVDMTVDTVVVPVTVEIVPRLVVVVRVEMVCTGTVRVVTNTVSMVVWVYSNVYEVEMELARMVSLDVDTTTVVLMAVTVSVVDVRVLVIEATVNTPVVVRVDSVIRVYVGRLYCTWTVV